MAVYRILGKILLIYDKPEYSFALYFINLNWYSMARSDSLIKYNTSHHYWREDWTIIYFQHSLKQISQIIKVTNLGKFITILLCHNTALFYLWYYIYFMTLICLLTEVTKSSLETYNTTYITDFNECNREKRDKIASIGTVDTLGIHLIKKGSTMAASSVFKIYPPIVALYLHAGW